MGLITLAQSKLRTEYRRNLEDGVQQRLLLVGGESQDAEEGDDANGLLAGSRPQRYELLECRPHERVVVAHEHRHLVQVLQQDCKDIRGAHGTKKLEVIKDNIINIMNSDSLFNLKNPFK